MTGKKVAKKARPTAPPFGFLNPSTKTEGNANFRFAFCGVSYFCFFTKPPTTYHRPPTKVAKGDVIPAYLCPIVEKSEYRKGVSDKGTQHV